MLFISKTVLPAMNASGAGRHGWAPMNSATVVCVLARVRVRAHANVRDVFAIYDNNILPRLIMKIIKIIVQYFIQIRHTDDFLSTGTSLVSLIMSLLLPVHPDRILWHNGLQTTNDLSGK